MTSDLPRVRTHSDGQIAVYVPEPNQYQDDVLPWLCADPADPASRVWRTDKDVSGPGWRDAVVVPLPEQLEPHIKSPAHFDGGAGAFTYGGPLIYLPGLGHLSPGDARRIAASLLAAAEHLDRQPAEAVSTDG